MTLPSTEELQHLLNAAAPGEWQFQDYEEWEHVAGPEYPPQQVAIAHTVEVDGVPLFGHANDDVLEDYPGNLRIAALAPVLAAEVIRLREAIETVAQISETRARNCHESNQLVAAAGHTVTASHLHGILEGDQE
ncbi:hypothetical protein [Corynebacterium dentalis]|uniref:hypothetical protein n=1 Tax=Corynebacterium dentalis TaxID=2014528 RepID=UPI00370DB1F0